ncbi:hypothetical protein LTR92_002904 [Exophiala xenobiotica]|nr:hypothetical protein LTR92_002904 [Exophiala xenobiotica]KAK5320100.1 hypothetical protein LTR93_007157 [Exophiala xenobiotica]KAK5406285.1 hypothetical protein LTR06_008640 [Exophiala xenobiotica]
MASYLNVLGVPDTESDSCDDVSDTVKVPKKPASRTNRKRPGAPVDDEAREKKRQQAAARSERKAEEARNLLFVGVDIGTTCSGLAFCSYKESWDKLTVISRYHGGENEHLEKVPTRIAYAAENDMPADVFGDAVEDGMTAYQWFKLLLAGKLKPTEFDDPHLEKATGNKTLRLPKGKTAQAVLTDFLTLLCKLFLKRLKKAMGSAKAVEKTKCVFVVTVPATWPLAARQATRDAAVAAGFGGREGDEVVLIDEPEAAAVLAIKSAIARYDTSAFEASPCPTNQNSANP